MNKKLTRHHRMIEPMEARILFHIDFFQEPANVVFNQHLAPVLVGEATTDGNPITTTGNITLSINSGVAGGVLGGTLTEPMVNGIATFSDLSINVAGTYTLSANDGFDPQGESYPFEVFLEAPSPLTPGFASIGSNLPPSVVTGSRLHDKVVVGLTNTSATLSSGITKVAIYASTFDGVDADSILLNSVSPKLKIPANSFADVTVPITALPAALSGTYTLVAQVTDPLGKTAVTDGKSPFSLADANAQFTVSAPFIEFSTYFRQILGLDNAATGVKSRATVQVDISNIGNIVSKGFSTVALYLSPDGKAGDGTLLHSETLQIAIKPGASKVITVPVLAIPAVPSGNYDVVAQVTDPDHNVTTIANGGAPFTAATESLQPFGVYPTAAHGGAEIVHFMVNDAGNYSFPARTTTINIYASTDGTLTHATRVYSRAQPLAWKPMLERTYAIQLTAAQRQTITAAGMVVVEVVDFTGKSLIWSAAG